MGAADYLLLAPRAKTFSQVRELRMSPRSILGQQQSIGTIYTICPLRRRLSLLLDHNIFPIKVSFLSEASRVKFHPTNPQRVDSWP